MQNEFSILLRDLIQRSGVKNQSVSDAAGYDLSYISKWLSGRMLPSEKNIDKTIDAVAKCIVNVDPLGVNKLSELYDCGDTTDLATMVKTDLKRAYQASKEESANDSADNHFLFISDVQSALMIIDDGMASGENIAAIIDIFCLDRENRLELLGVKDGQFYRKYNGQKGNIELVIDVLHCDNIVEDALFLIHFLSSLSARIVKLYSSPDAYQKLVCVIGNDSAVSGMMLGNGKTLLAGNRVRGSELCFPLVTAIAEMKGQERLIFVRRDMNSFLNHNEYVKTLLATNVRWLIGHATELVCPDSIYQDLSLKVQYQNTDELFKVHLLAKNAINHELTMILLYESAILDLIATGTIDFFNEKFQLSRKQVKEYIQNIIDICKQHINVRMVIGGFNPDFKHIYNPCLYLSDAISYVRLEEAYDHENIMITNDESLRDLFSRFYYQVWNNRHDVVIDSSEVIIEKMKHFLELVDALDF